MRQISGLRQSTPRQATLSAADRMPRNAVKIIPTALAESLLVSAEAVGQTNDLPTPYLNGRRYAEFSEFGRLSYIAGLVDGLLYGSFAVRSRGESGPDFKAIEQCIRKWPPKQIAEVVEKQMKENRSYYGDLDLDTGMPALTTFALKLACHERQYR